MASALYSSYKQSLLDSSCPNLDSGTIKVTLVDTADYTLVPPTTSRMILQEQERLPLVPSIRQRLPAVSSMLLMKYLHQLVEIHVSL